MLKKHKVHIWLFGHTHMPTMLGGKTRRSSSLNGTVFVNMSAIREDYMISYSESRFIYFVPGSSKVLIRTRNHREEEFVKSEDYIVELDKPFIYNGEEPLFMPFK